MAKEYKREGNKAQVITTDVQEIDINMLRDQRDRLKDKIKILQDEIDIVNTQIDFLKSIV